MSFRSLLRLMDDLNDLSDPFGTDMYINLQPVHPTRLRGLEDFPVLKFIDCLGELEKGGPRKILPSAQEEDDCCFTMDVHDFQADDISIKVVDNYVVIEGEHEEREDEHGFVARHFKRRYTIPDGFDKESIDTTISPEGLLHIRVKKAAKSPEPPTERLVEIQLVGPAKSPSGIRSAEDIQ